jgi:hypothetical protein
MSNSAFVNVCRHGDLEMAKQLLEENPDINTSEIEEAYRYACKNKRYLFVRWLSLVIDGYYY